MVLGSSGTSCRNSDHTELDDCYHRKCLPEVEQQC